MQENVDGMNEEFEREAGAAVPAGGAQGGPSAKEGEVDDDDGVVVETAAELPVPVPEKKADVKEKEAPARPRVSSTAPPPAASTTTTARSLSGSKVDERRRMFETKSTSAKPANGPGPSGTAAKEGFRLGGKAK
jgi:hypothetical protein